MKGGGGGDEDSIRGAAVNNVFSSKDSLLLSGTI